MKKNLLSPEEIKQAVQDCEQCLVNLKAKWDEIKPIKSGWFKISSDYLLKGTVFIINSIDYMIQFVEPIIPKGTDKKAIVLLVAGQLYDYVLVPILPLWLKPISATLKKLLITVVISQLIDFIVSKYRAGAWNMETNGKENFKLQL